MTKIKTPDDFLTSGHEFMMRNKRHDSLAPKVAEERWQALQAVVTELNRLDALYYERAEAAEDAELAAVAAHARAASSGKAVPAGSAAKVTDAQLAVKGTLSAFTATLPRLEAARKAYDALFEDHAFLAEYRAVTSEEFLKRRKAALEAFAVLDRELPALAELYGNLGRFTFNGLLADFLDELGEELDRLVNINTFMPSNHGWSAPQLTEAFGKVREFVVNGDPIYGGTLLAEDLKAVKAELPALVEQREEEAHMENAANRMMMVGGSPWGRTVH
jgi:hypothetical protein